MLDLTTMRGNRLLARLPGHVLERLLPAADLIDFSIRAVVSRPGEVPAPLYFPLGGVASIMTGDESGAAIEVATVGREGMLGVTTLFGAGALPFEVMWQIPGRAVRLEIEIVRPLLATEPVFADVAARYLGALLAQAGQNAGCNRMHTIEQRAAKWLLLSRDRTEAESFPLTQEFFAIMLGVTRPKLSLVQSAFQRAGLISYGRGVITILDGRGLEDQACDCYAVIAAQVASVDARD
jgi:CRP-like cAMP-binding protein